MARLDLGNVRGPAGPTGPRGPAGPTGAKGERGDTGARGERGERGSVIHAVSGVPLAQLGAVGDWCIDGQTGAFYEKTKQGWQRRGCFQGQAGEQGEPGKPGSAPVFELGANGHLYAIYEEE